MDLSTNRLRLLLGLLLLAALVGYATPAAQGALVPQAGSTLALSCESCFVIDDLGRVLWERAPDTPLPNASTTKMVTALVVIRDGDLDSSATVSAAVGSVGGGGLDLQAGDTLSVRDLLVAMLLSSSNEAAATLAEHVGGSQDAFVGRMNAYARRIGAENTHFENPHGLDATGHHSTARDLALIGAEVLDDPVLAPIVATSRATIDTPRGPSTETNRNLLLEGYTGAIGIKTGRTLGAGNVLVAAARRGPRTLIAVAMRSADAASDATELLDEGFRVVTNLDRKRPLKVLEQGTVVGQIVFDPGGSISVVAGRSVTLELPPNPPPVRYRVLPRALVAPLESGEHVGRIELVSGSRTIATVPLLAADRVEEPRSSLGPNLLGRVMSLVAGAVGLVT